MRLLRKRVGGNCGPFRLWITSALLMVFCAQIQTAQSAGTNFKPLDLSAVSNIPRSNSAPEVVAFPSGKQTIDDVPFVLGGRVAVTGMDAARAGNFLPPQIAGINVRQKAARLHLLHGAIHGKKDGTPLGNLVLHYKDGSTRRLRLIFGVHARNAIDETETTVKNLVDPNSDIAWQKEFPGPTSIVARIYHTVLENSLPDQEITMLDYESLFSRATPVLFGITLQSGERLPPMVASPKRKVVQKGGQFEDSIYRHPLVLHVTGLSAAGNGLRDATAVVTLQDDARTYFFGQYRTDPSGQISLSFPPQYAAAVNIRVSSPGLVPESIVLASKDSGKWPESLNVALQAGDSIGGLVVDSAGKAVPGATVIPYQIRQTGPNEYTRTDLDVVKTGPDGKWRGAALASNLPNIHFEINHPEYRLASTQFPAQDLLGKKAKSVLEAHPRVAGRILSSAGKPLANASVILDLGETHLVNSTDAKGRYSFVVRDPTNTGAGLIAIATNYAPVYQSVSLRAANPAPDIVLQPGSRFSMTLLDQGRRPVAGVKVKLEDWQGSKAMQWENQTDSQGRFTWDHAPSGPVIFQYQKPGFLTQTHSMTLPISGETMLTLSRRVVATARVVDAETRKPLDNFKVRVKYKYQNGGGSGSTTGRKGSFTYTLGSYTAVEEVTAIVEARGYQPVSHELILNESGSYSNFFELKKAVPIIAFVVGPDGSPAAAADVILLDSSSNASMDENGRFSRASTLYDLAVSDPKGRVELTPKLDPDLVLASHRTLGFAQVPASNVLNGAKIVLQPWGHVKGVLRVVDKIEPYHFVGLGSLYTYRAGGRSGIPLYVYLKTKPDADGHFSFDKVPPGDRSVSLRYQFKEKNSGTMHLSHTTPVVVKPGETSEVVIGGGGRMVTGKAVYNGPNASQIDWTLYSQTLRPQFRPQTSFLPRLSNPSGTPEERQRMMQQEAEARRLEAEKENMRVNNMVYALVFEPDGTFKVPDLPPGTYMMHIAATMPRSGGSYSQMGYLSQQVTVPEGKGPYDLGTFQVKSNNNN
jgi:hypothetical protein